MNHTLIIEAGIAEYRLALLSNEKLMNCIILREKDQSDVGARFFGRVRVITKQNDSAFVDIGGQDAFLSFRRAKSIAPQKNPRSISDSVFEGQLIEVEIIRDRDEADGKLPLISAITRVENKSGQIGRIGSIPTLTERVLQKIKGWDVDHVIFDHATSKALFARSLNDGVESEIIADPFGAFGINAYLDGAIAGTLDLPSGGKVHIEKTRALWVFDVDTAAGGAGRGAQATRLNTNIEAARAIGQAINVLNIGGLMVIDFIDLEKPNDQKSVLATLNKATSQNGEPLPRTNFSKFSLVELKRRKDGPSLIEYLGDKNHSYNQAAQAHKLLRDSLMLGRSGESGALVLTIPHQLNDWIQSNNNLVDQLIEATHRKLDFIVSSQHVPNVSLKRT